VVEHIYNTCFERTLFNSISNSYDNVNNIANFRLPIFIRKKIIKNLEINSGGLKILDLMSGQGENWEELNHRFPKSEITAIDISENMARISRENCRKWNESNIQIINDDIFNADFASDYFDLVICSFGLKCLSKSQIEEIVPLLKRILKKNGSFVFIEVSKPQNVILRISQKIHFKYVVPLIAGILDKKFKDYQLLWRFLDAFNVDEVISIFRKNGIHIKTKRYLFGNITTIMS